MDEGAIVEFDGGEEFEVQEIRDKRVIEGQEQYLIKWLDYTDEFNTWEPVDNLTGCHRLLEEFENRQRPPSSGKVLLLLDRPAADTEMASTTQILGADFPDDENAARTEALTSPGADNGTELMKPELRIEKIIRAVGYRTKKKNGKRDLAIIFRVKRTDGHETTVDNKLLRTINPLLLVDFYEQHVLFNGSKPE